MNRSDFQNLAGIRREDAQILLEQRNYSGAYYLCGYVIECGLKACIAKQTRKYDFPPDQKTVRDIYTHDLELLIKSAGLKSDLEKDLDKDGQLAVCWALVKDWTEKSRYEECTKKKAKDLYEAVVDKKHGVLQWISQRW